LRRDYTGGGVSDSEDALRAPSDPSGSAEADRDLPVLHDHRDLAAPGETDHSRELVLVLFDVDVPNGIPATRVVLTGLGRIGSGVLPEDLDRRIVHRVTSRAMITVSPETGCYDFFEV